MESPGKRYAAGCTFADLAECQEQSFELPMQCERAEKALSEAAYTGQWCTMQSRRQT